MATTTKQYTISIQLDAAQQALADTSKKLATLDEKLAGLDRNSAAAKAIVAEMAQLAKQVEAAGGTVEGLNRRLDGLKPGTIGALKQEFKDLTRELNNTAEGSAEANRLLVRLGEVKGEIKGLKDEVKALDPEQRINAFNNFAQGVVGAFGVATVAAEAFGLSSASAEEFTKKTQGVIAALQGLEGIRNALDGETLKSIKSTLALGKAYITGGEAASTGAKVTRVALASTGIGLLIVAVGLLISNFDTVKEYAGKIYQKFKPQFDALGKLVGGFIDTVRDLASAVSFGLIDDATAHAKVVLVAAQKEQDAFTDEATKRRIAVLEAAGKDTYALRRELAQRELNGLKRDTAEQEKIYLDKERDLGVLEATEARKRADEAEKNRKAEEQKQKEAAAKAKAAREKQANEDFQAFKARNEKVDKTFAISAQDRLRLDLDAETKRQEEVAKRGQEMAAAASKITEQAAAETAERVRIAAIPKLSFTDTLLVRVFGVAPGQLEQTKARVLAAAEAVNSAVGQYYAGVQAEADARVEEAQQRLSLATQALDQASKKRQEDEKALQGATGARRDFLLAKLAKERQEEERLNAAKNKAAADEKKRLKEQAQLQKEAQRGSLALSAALAVQAAIEAIKSASALPFPANIPAIIVAGATVASGVFAAKALGNAFADGGFVTGPGGPRADQVPAVLSNGEFVVNADATAKNRALLESMNASNNRVLPPGTLGAATGAGGGSAEGAGAQSADLQQLIADHRELIGLTKQLVGHAATTAQKPPLVIGPYEATQIERQRQSVLSAEASAAL